MPKIPNFAGVEILNMRTKFDTIRMCASEKFTKTGVGLCFRERKKLKVNETGKTIASMSSTEIKLDNQVKKVLACKPILSRILAEVVEECKGMDYQEVESCIEGKVKITQVNMEPGFTSIEGQAQEDYEVGEGLIKYDIRTFLRLPNCDKPQLAKILIDVEAQKDEHPGYDIPVRGLFYCCRMISSQLTKEFSVATDDPNKYDNIKKVYSIWICTETSQKRANSIEKYGIKKEILCGENTDYPRYDILSAIMINLSKYHNYGKTECELIRFLTDLFNETIPAEEKLRILENNYHLRVTEEIRKEVSEMCTYTSTIARGYMERGLEQGLEQGKELGEKKLSTLIIKLIEARRDEDIAKAASDEAARKVLYLEFGIDE